MTLARILTFGFLVGAATSALAADETPAKDGAIVVTAPRLPGSVETDAPPELVLDEAAIASYGASSVTELLSSLNVQTRTGRGRGGGMPIVLLNGRRVSGFAEMRDLPPEAIRRVEVFPEEVALRYGYPPDQRVVNFILKDGFHATTIEYEAGGPTKGGRTTGQIEAGLLTIGKKARTSLNGEYNRSGSILESERGIIAQGPDVTSYRTIVPRSDTLKLNGVMNRTFNERTGATINLTLDRSNAASLFGAVSRPGGALDPLNRDRRSTNAAAGTTVDGFIGRWRWNGTARLNADWTRTLTDQVATTNRDLATSRLITASASWTMSGPLMRLPGGSMVASGTLGYDRLDFASHAERSAITTDTKLGRGIATARGSIDIPIASRRTGALQPLGNVSVNLNGAYRDLSDFGGLASYGFGLNWSPVEGLNFSGSVSSNRAAPSLNQLRDPPVTTPGVTTFDFVRGESAIVTQLAGGNLSLLAEKQRDTKVSASWEIFRKDTGGLTLNADYYSNRSNRPLAAFPVISAAVQAAFPGRITRDASGRLTAIDVRTINYQSSRSEELRWGLTLVRQKAPPGGGGFGGPRGPGSGPRPGGGGGGGGGMGFGGPPGGKRMQVSLFHTVKFTDQVNIAPGVPVLDLLHGDATGTFGGTPRNKVELEGGYYANGFGMRFNGSWDSGSTVRSPLSPDLRFSSLATLNLRLFLNFDQKKNLVKSAPFLKGSRMLIRIDNLTGAIRHVRDATRGTPIRYQDGYNDPLGRVVTLSFRKQF